ncbi:MAG: GNAT family N-acetyltransferase [Peptostreptococcaceae bacterium]|nr:GNAT family N-acetyltransferase [Peptostreptococcaceae bacterium]
MKFTHQNDENKGQFTAFEGEKQAGLITYVWEDKDHLIIDHTEVEPEFEGQGVGEKLVMAVADYAEKNGLRIRPFCPFAVDVFDGEEKLQPLRF